MMEEIYTHASKEAPRECCGLVIQEGINEKYIPMENISPQKNTFEMDSKTFAQYQLNSKIKYVVHSHYDQKSTPSEVDKDTMSRDWNTLFNRFLSRQRIHNYTTMTRNIYLKGRMGKLFGEHHRLNVKTVQEAMHAIDTMKGGLRQYLIDCTENNVKFSVQKGEDFLSNQTAGIELGKDDIIITPVPRGSAKDGLTELIIGVILIIVGFSMGDPDTVSRGAQLLISIGTSLALQGIVTLLTDEPDVPQ
jgi:predicted phage tail protein/proteasome lid subunit RPN8/RPN11